MENTVFVRTYTAPEYDKKEILRFAGMKGASDEVNALIDECIAELGEKLVFKVCFCNVNVCVCDNVLDLGFAKVPSKDLAKNLENCNSAVLFAATVGIEIDRLIARYATLSPVKSLIFQAIGAERVESLCDMFNVQIVSEAEQTGKKCRPRFSPGYGDLPLGIQKEIFRVLDCPRKIGLSLNESMLMSPSKSVTAFIGIEK